MAETTTGWRPIETAPDIEWSSDLPHEADDGMGWAWSDDEREFVFLVWFTQIRPGYAKATHWHPLPAAPLDLSTAVEG